MNCNWKSREGLYIMVFIILLNTCSMKEDVRKIESFHEEEPKSNISKEIIDTYKAINNNVEEWLRIK